MGKILTFRKGKLWSGVWLDRDPECSEENRLVLSIGQKDGQDLPKIHGMPRSAALRVDFERMPELVKTSTDGKHFLVADLDIYSIPVPARSGNELPWEQGRAYRAGFVVKHDNGTWRALRDVKPGAEFHREEWERVLHQMVRMGRPVEGSSHRYLLIDCQTDTYRTVGMIDPEENLGMVSTLLETCGAPTESGRRLYFQECVLGLKPGAAVKFQTCDGMKWVIAYPTDILTEEENQRSCEGLLLFEGWAEFETWCDENPGWDQIVEGPKHLARNLEALPKLPETTKRELRPNDRGKIEHRRRDPGVSLGAGLVAGD